jgi:hypothetical protein
MQHRRAEAVAGAESKRRRPPVLKAWVDGLTLRDEDIQVRLVVQRLIHPGLEGIRGEGFVAAHAERQLDLPGSWTHSASVLQWHERVDGDPDPLAVEEQDSAIGALLTLVTDRRCQVVPEVLAQVTGAPKPIAIPVAHQVDPALGAPMPTWEELNDELRRTLGRIASLEDNDARAISDTMHMHYCATLLASGDLTGAYALVVGGLERLAHEYGAPPSDWAEWDEAAGWDAFMAEQQMSEDQRVALRDRLMGDKHMRLAETFATYVSDRLPPAFWEEPVPVYQWSVDGVTGEPLEGRWEVGAQRAGAFAGDRRELKRALKRSYQARSRFIHAGERSVPFAADLVSRIPGHGEDRVSFAALRAALRRLILIELEARARGDRLPPLEVHFNTGADTTGGSSA